MVRAVWTALPWLATASLLMMSALAGLPPFVAQGAAAASLMAGAYYVAMQPSRLSIFACASLGLLQDVLTFVPLGASAAGWIALYLTISAIRVRLAPEGFFMHWMLAACGLCVLLGVQGMTVALFNGGRIAWNGLGTLWLLGVLFYPMLHEALHGLDRAYWRRWWPLLRAAQ
ncbi:MAG: hypothetical protein JO089_06505 [Alphaproteobacteria bacterium]|nr:hypothetical protein [Alphaproteobacteria bacterium]